MIDQHEDPKFEHWLVKVTQEYNAPPATPRDRMWQRMEEARRSKRVIELRPWLRWAIAAAAVLVVGIGIGRWSVNQKSPSGARAVVAMDTARQDAAYQVAAQQYLSRTEVLLTDFRAQSARPGGRLDPQFVASARDLLTTTRLMLDSPAAARDPRLQPLLEDLELVLAQITQLPAEPGRKTEMDFINQGMNQRSVLTRLRTATPAVPGTVPVRAEGAL
ncbi:MAG TPA: hypothetical protein VKQ05_13215 [Gemmatimonadales bacterium]|nr:hypothetical protein [Gemmatimonadales bacterium]